MLIAPDVGTTFELGPYTVRIALRPDNPAFARYLIFKADALIGRQFSRPSESDCEWHDQRRGIYAMSSHTSRVYTIRRAGRPTNAERLRRASFAVEDVAA